MSPVFSASDPLFPSPERPPQPMDLQLLPTEELMSLWEQTQRASWVMEDRGMDAGGPQYYAGLVVWELQRRLSLHPGIRFLAPGRDLAGGDPTDAGGAADGPAPLPRILSIRI